VVYLTERGPVLGHSLSLALPTRALTFWIWPSASPLCAPDQEGRRRLGPTGLPEELVLATDAPAGEPAVLESRELDALRAGSSALGDLGGELWLGKGALCVRWLNEDEDAHPRLAQAQ